jgi:molybdopterin-guanine dinucleotide biosynthesis protein A
LTEASVPAVRDVTLGVLAGGRATRLGGVDKAWLLRDGVAQIVRLAQRFAPEVETLIVSANRDVDRYQAHGFAVVTDRITDIGPLGGLDALAQSCATRWLLTLPVDVVAVNDCLLPSLTAAGGQGAFAVDDEGVQPLVALWNVGALRDAVARALAAEERSVQAVQKRLDMTPVRLVGVRFGNLNTPADLVAAGMDPA